MSLRFILDARRANQHFKVRPKFPMAIGDVFSRVELVVGNPDESAALAIHIASDDVQNAFHHMSIPEWFGPYFCLRLLSARAFGMTGKDCAGKSGLCGAEVVSCASDAANGFSLRLFFHQHVGLYEANCADLPLRLPVITSGPPTVVGANPAVRGATLTDRCL